MSYAERADAELVEFIARQDNGSLEALYDRYAGVVYSLAIHMLKDSKAAEEVTQDVFFNVWRRASSYRAERGKVISWLFGIAHHRTVDELRRRRRERAHVQMGVDLTNKPDDDADDPPSYAASRYERGRLEDALSYLRPEQREVVVLAYFGGLTHSEIAGRLQQPLGTVKTRMRLALRKLREVLGPQGWEQPHHGL